MCRPSQTPHLGLSPAPLARGTEAAPSDGPERGPIRPRSGRGLPLRGVQGHPGSPLPRRDGVWPPGCDQNPTRPPATPRKRQAGRGRRGSRHHGISKTMIKGAVFQDRLPSRLCYTSYIVSQHRTRVKLNRVFFPRFLCQARSPGCGFAR